MSVANVFNHYILEDKTAKLEFFSKKDLIIFLGCLRVYKSRYEKQLRELAMPELDLINGRVISHRIITEEETDKPFVVEIFLGQPTKFTGDSKINFKLLE